MPYTGFVYCYVFLDNNRVNNLNEIPEELYYELKPAIENHFETYTPDEIDEFDFGVDESLDRYIIDFTTETPIRDIDIPDLEMDIDGDIRVVFEYKYSNVNTNNKNKNNWNNVNYINVPANTTNSITDELIEEGNHMVTFHGNLNRPNSKRYYKKSTFNSLQSPKKNPFTRELIKSSNIKKYKARIVGGKTKKVRKLNKTRKLRKLRKNKKYNKTRNYRK
jgi:hypothetical protein